MWNITEYLADRLLHVPPYRGIAYFGGPHEGEQRKKDSCAMVHFGKFCIQDPNAENQTWQSAKYERNASGKKIRESSSKQVNFSRRQNETTLLT